MFNNKTQDMNKIILSGLFVSTLLFSCSKEEETVLTPSGGDDQSPTTALSADFTAEVSGESPNAQITISNTSEGASTYEWSFSEGASLSSSTEEIPATLTVDKAGTFSITLVAKDGEEEKEITKTLTISGHNAIQTYTNIAFDLDGDIDDQGRMFSFDTEKMYKDSEVTDSIGSMIHLLFNSYGNTMYFFTSPTDEEFGVPQATETKIVNYESDPTITLEEFDAMTDDQLLTDLTIVDTGESFGNSTISHTVLFEISDGRKGVIKTKAVNSDRLLADIKIQKY